MLIIDEFDVNLLNTENTLMLFIAIFVPCNLSLPRTAQNYKTH